MAERQVSVRFSARVDQYMAAVARMKAGTLGFSRDSQRNLARLGTSMQSVGRNMTLGLTVPLLGAGAAGVKLATGFDRSMSLITGLVGLSRAEVDSMRDSVLKLAGETALAPQELADALYFITSSGFSGSEALDVLEASAKAAAAGLGDAATIADLTTSAINAYGHDVLSAGEATDILTEAVRLGKGEPAELAGAMSRVLPIASEMGVEFDEVAAAMASMSLTGLDANEAATALRGILSALLSPTAEARDALTGVGLSVEGIQASLADDGLLATLQLLQEKFGGNAEATEVVFGNVRALTGVLSILGGNAEATAAIFDDMSDSTGAADKAFQSMTETSGFKLKQAWVEMQIALIALGDILVPIVAKVGGALASMASWFANLNPAIQTIITVFGGLVAAIGPLVFIAGSLIRNLFAIRGGLALMGTGAKIATGALGGLALAATAAFIAYQGLTENQRKTEQVTRDAAAALDTQLGSLVGVAEAAATTGGAIDAVTIANEALSLAISEASEGLSSSLATFNVTAEETLDVLALYDEDPVAAVTALAESFGLPIAAAQEFARMVTEGTTPDAMRAFGAEVGLTEDEIRALSGAMFVFIEAQKSAEPNDIALAFLNARVRANDLQRSLVLEAESMVGSRFATENALPVFRQYAILAAERGVLVGDATDAEIEAAEATRAVTVALADAMEVLAISPGLWRDIKAELDKFTASGASIGEMAGFWADLAETLGYTHEEALVLAGSITAITERGGTPDVAAWDMWAESIGWTGEQLQNVVMMFVALDEAANAGKQAPRTDAIKDTSGALDEMTGHLAEATDETEELSEVSSDMSRAFDDASAAANRLQEAIDAVIGPGRNLRDTEREVWDASQDLIAGLEEQTKAAEENGEAFDINTDAFDIHTEAGRKNAEQIERNIDAFLDHGVAMVENGASAEEAAGDIALNTQNMWDNLEAAGLSEEAIRELRREYDLTPEEVETILRLEGEKRANEVIARYNSLLDKIPPEQRTEIQALIDEGDYAEADRRLDALEGTATVHVQANMSAFYNAIAAARNVSIVARVLASVRSAEGRFVPGGSNLLSTLGEEPGATGDEVVLPLGNERRMQSLLSLPGVGDRVAAAMSGLMMPSTQYAPVVGTVTDRADRDMPAIIFNNYGRDVTVDQLARLIRQARTAA